MRHVPAIACTLALVLALTAGAASPQAQSSYCSLVTLGNPERSALRCSDGFLVEIEAAARTGPDTPVPDEAPESLDLDEGAVLIELEPGRRSFQIQTPHAIAAARGTVYVVDADAAETDVFVVSGEVMVTRRSDGAEVMLGAGEGVDVADGEPLVVNVWGAARVEALLARFGR